ncbi:hypothetical protein JL720_261 [Aureococcus anophagefferens]|nr:hypothetical protein JL720_261 [Aureococcus anophagefferens]
MAALACGPKPYEAQVILRVDRAGVFLYADLERSKEVCTLTRSTACRRLESGVDAQGRAKVRVEALDGVAFPTGWGRAEYFSQCAATTDRPFDWEPDPEPRAVDEGDAARRACRPRPSTRPASSRPSGRRTSSSTSPAATAASPPGPWRASARGPPRRRGRGSRLWDHLKRRDGAKVRALCLGARPPDAYVAAKCKRLKHPYEALDVDAFLLTRDSRPRRRAVKAVPAGAGRVRMVSS